jgi:hypothetical protein
MKVVLLSKNGQSFSRDVYAEIGRRMKERGVTDEAVAAFRAAADEFQNEIEAYGASVP